MKTTNINTKTTTKNATKTHRFYFAVTPDGAGYKIGETRKTVGARLTTERDTNGISLVPVFYAEAEIPAACQPKFFENAIRSAVSARLAKHDYMQVSADYFTTGGILRSEMPDPTRADMVHKLGKRFRPYLFTSDELATMENEVRLAFCQLCDVQKVSRVDVKIIRGANEAKKGSAVTYRKACEAQVYKLATTLKLDHANITRFADYFGNKR